MPFIILRHDVDANPGNSLRIAQLEASLGIRGTYYFRCRDGGFEEEIIRKVAGLGHEIGYHYETLSQIGNRSSGFGYSILDIRYWLLNFIQWIFSVFHKRHNLQNRKVDSSSLTEKERLIGRAYGLFMENLGKFREIVPVETICMHGSPLSPYDNREIWKTYDYRELGIIGEASMDVDFSKVAYFTDTGRRWDGAGMSVRDKVLFKGLRDLETERLRDQVIKEETKVREDEGTMLRLRSAQGERGSELSPVPHGPCSMHYHHTPDILWSIREATFPEQAMITFHPQRWNDALLPWMKELIWQNVKNQVKWLMIKIRG